MSIDLTIRPGEIIGNNKREPVRGPVLRIRILE